jgi:hypothetical protein
MCHSIVENIEKITLLRTICLFSSEYCLFSSSLTNNQLVKHSATIVDDDDDD